MVGRSVGVCCACNGIYLANVGDHDVCKSCAATYWTISKRWWLRWVMGVR